MKITLIPDEEKKRFKLIFQDLDDLMMALWSPEQSTKILKIFGRCYAVIGCALEEKRSRR